MSAPGKENDYLSYLARTGQGFIHPGGMAATAWMLEKLSLESSDTVLEVGCGTGASMAMVLGNYPVKSVAGVEPNPNMARAARIRLKGSCPGMAWRVDAADLIGWNAPGAHFGKIFCESVLCLQGEAELRAMVAKIVSLLKPGGLFVAVETIWQKGTAQEAADAQNRQAMAAFGATTSTPMAWHQPAWCSLFRGTGFEIRSSDLLPDQDVLNRSIPPGFSVPHPPVLDRMARRLGNFWRLPEEWRYRHRLKAFESQPRLCETRLFLLEKAT